MSETSSNAYRQEAVEKRKLAQQYINEALALEAQADEIDGVKTPDEALPAGGENYTPEADQPKGKLFSKK